ncbi:hypothetical protein [Halobaculum lipolyticum]
MVFKEALREEFDLHDLSGATMDTVEDALEILANGREEEAIDRLRDGFESPCEQEDPVLTDGSHAVACHLYADEEYEADVAPEDIGTAMGGMPTNGADAVASGPADPADNGSDTDDA